MNYDYREAAELREMADDKTEAELTRLRAIEAASRTVVEAQNAWNAVVDREHDDREYNSACHVRTDAIDALRLALSGGEGK